MELPDTLGLSIPYIQVAGLPERQETLPLPSGVPSSSTLPLPLSLSIPFPTSFLLSSPCFPIAQLQSQPLIRKARDESSAFNSILNRPLYKPHTLPESHQGFWRRWEGVTIPFPHTVLLESTTARAPQRNRKETRFMCGLSPASAIPQLCDLGQVTQPLLAS